MKSKPGVSIDGRIELKVLAMNSCDAVVSTAAARHEATWWRLVGKPKTRDTWGQKERLARMN